MKLILLFVSISIVSITHSAKVTDCGSVVGSFTKVMVSDCKEIDKRCELKKGTNATIKIEFELSKSN